MRDFDTSDCMVKSERKLYEMTQVAGDEDLTDTKCGLRGIN